MTKSTMRRWGIGAALAAGMLTSAAMVSTARSADASVGSDAPTAAERGAQTPPTPTQGGDLVATGRRVFQRACGRCHPGGGATDDIGPHVTNINWEEARMTHQIRSGSNRMRPINTTRLPDSDLPALNAYMRSIHAIR